jgi:hypothetical protein
MRDSEMRADKRHTMAPKLWPVSCATICHSARPAVETAVPETTDGAFAKASCWHLVEENDDGTKKAPPNAQCCKPCDTDF